MSDVTSKLRTKKLVHCPGVLRRAGPMFTLVSLIFSQPLVSTDASLEGSMSWPNLSVAVFCRAQYHLVSKPVRRVQATLNDTFRLSEMNARQWTVYAPDASDSDDQKDVVTAFDVLDHQATIAKWSELSPLKRPLLQAIVAGGGDNGATLNTRVTYTGTLLSRQLVPGPPPSPVAPLPAAQRKLYTRASRTIDYTDPAFQSWLDDRDLRRRHNERDLDFALRVFESIRDSYIYTYDLGQDRRASVVCSVDKTDCGGLSQLFVAAMRASAVPAYSLCGRIALTTNDPSDHGNCHVKAQFYASGIGWVPVEMSGATWDRSAPYWVYFGRTYGNFITLSVDNDQMLSTGAGEVENLRGMQGVRFWVWGAEGADDQLTSTSAWTVHTISSLPPSSVLASGGSKL